MAIKPDCGVGHHKACPCREAAVERLCDAAERLVARYPQTSLNFDALLGLDVLEVREAVAAVRGPREESDD